MKKIPVESAVGMELCHDITAMRDGFKGAAFKRGHIITEEDIPVLLSVGKDTIYIWEVNENMMHENDAARVLCELSINEHMHASDISEGKIELIADCPGLLKVDKKRLNAINSLGEMMIASRHGNFAVKAGDKIAGMRVIPLIIEKQKMEAARAAVEGGRIFSLMPFAHKKVGIVTTGNEVFYGRIEGSRLVDVQDIHVRLLDL